MSKLIVSIHAGVFDSSGGCLVSQETGVSIVIPAGAVPTGKAQEIYFKASDLHSDGSGKIAVTYEAEAEDITPEYIINEILNKVEVP